VISWVCQGMVISARAMVGESLGRESSGVNHESVGN